MRNIKYNWRYKNYEIRQTTTNYLKLGEVPTLELVFWRENSCFTLSYWTRYSQGYQLTFVSDRMFNYLPEKHLALVWSQLAIAEEVLHDYWDLFEEEEE